LGSLHLSSPKCIDRAYDNQKDGDPNAAHMQKGASFNMTAVKAQIEQAIAAHAVQK
jgi:hypothetical protein